MSKMKVRNNTLMKIICYGQATNQGMVWFRIVRIGSIFGCIFLFAQIGMVLSPYETIDPIYGPNYPLYIILSTLPGLILGIIATYGLFNLKYWTYKWLVAAVLPINSFLSMVFLALLPEIIIYNILPSLIAQFVINIFVSAIAITYFSKRKDIFNPNGVVTTKEEIL
mgnify:CR=1 FL=1